MMDQSGATHSTDPAKARQVELILERIDKMPTLPTVAVHLLSIGSAEEASFDEVVRLIESDPALTATLLSLCRRASRGLVDRIDSVHRAVVLLGFEAVRSAALSVSVFGLMNEQADESERRDAARQVRDGEPEPVDRTGLWRHAVAVACASELIAHHCGGRGVRPDQAFTAGLLHDLGRLGLAMLMPRAMSKVAGVAERRACDAAPVERALLGLDHHTAGRRLAAHWGLPDAFGEVMWMHSQPKASVPEGDHTRLIGVVTVAKAVCRAHHLGWSGDFADPEPCDDWIAFLGIEREWLDAITGPLMAEVAARCKALRLDDAATDELLMRSLQQANIRLSELNTRLRDQSAKAKPLQAALEQIDRFHADWSSQLSVTQTLEQIARSAANAMGEGFLGAIFQPAWGGPWRLHGFGPRGRLAWTRDLTPPRDRDRLGLTLGAAPAGQGLSIAAASVLPWLTDELIESDDIRRVRLIPLCGSGEASAPAAVLLHDRESTAVPDGAHAAQLPDSAVAALRSAWSAAVRAAATHEEASRTEERLAEATRSLGEAQRRLTQAESMARLGEVTAGAAHEMNNPLTVIRGRSQLLAKSAKDMKARAEARSIADAAAQLSTLVSGLHLLASPPEPEIELKAIDEILLEAIAGARKKCDRVSPERCELRTLPGLMVQADPRLLASAVAEVIVNAFEASQNEPVALRAQRDALDGRVVVQIRDRGPGLSDKARKHAFDPFFSDKPAGRQTGLGLARARRLIELHGGEITLECPASGGTRATVRLPAAAVQSDPASADPPAEDDAGTLRVAA